MTDEDFNVIWRGLEARLERLEDTVKDLDEAIRGSRRTKDPGLVAEQDRIDLIVRKLSAVVFTDSTGKHGLAHDVDVLMGRQVGADRRSEFRWKYWIPTLLAILAMVLTFLTNLDQIKQNWPHLHLSPLEKKIEKAKHPKGRKIVKIRVIGAPMPSPVNPPSASTEAFHLKSE